MRYLKRFENKISIFDSEDWSKLLPKELTIVTNNGEFTLKVKTLQPELGYPGIYNLMNCISFIYYQNTVENEGGDVTADGEPDYLQFDITLVKDNDGTESNPDSLRLNIDITYGDHMQYEFTIDKPNKVKVYHYTGKNSLYDKDTFWGFKFDSLQMIVDFLNRFGFSTTIDDFKFMDEVPDSFEYKDTLKNEINNYSNYLLTQYIKETFKQDIEIDLAHLIDEGFVVNIDEHWTKDGDPNWSSSLIRIWLPIDKTDTEYSYENSKDFNWSDIEDEIIRTVSYILESSELEYMYTLASLSRDGHGYKRTKWSIDELMDGMVKPGDVKCFLMSVKHK